jgi:hypothetical protein
MSKYGPVERVQVVIDAKVSPVERVQVVVDAKVGPDSSLRSALPVGKHDSEAVI